MFNSYYEYGMVKNDLETYILICNYFKYTPLLTPLGRYFTNTT